MVLQMQWRALFYSFVGRVFAPRLLSYQTKDLEWRTSKPPQRVTALASWTDHVIALRSQTDRVIALRQISVTALFYLEDSRPVHLRGVRARRSKDGKRRAPQFLGSSFYMFFSPPWACLMQIGLRQERCSTCSPHSGPRTFLCCIFTSFSLPYLLASAILDSFSLF